MFFSQILKISLPYLVDLNLMASCKSPSSWSSPCHQYSDFRFLRSTELNYKVDTSKQHHLDDGITVYYYDDVDNMHDWPPSFNRLLLLTTWSRDSHNIVNQDACPVSVTIKKPVILWIIKCVLTITNLHELIRAIFSHSQIGEEFASWPLFFAVVTSKKD